MKMLVIIAFRHTFPRLGHNAGDSKTYTYSITYK